MFAIIGIFIVAGSVGLGYFMAKGNFSVLFQPAEIVIIMGAAFGALVISSPKDVIFKVFGGFASIFKGGKTSKAYYVNMLLMFSQLFGKIRREGLVAIEKDIENPKNSDIFKTFARDKSNLFILDFICDTMRVFSTVSIEKHEFEALMDGDIEVIVHEHMTPSHSIEKVADALPGLGIVAAVLGVVLTMGKINEPPEVLGHYIGAALVGTFLGVLMSYGFVGPIAQNLAHKAHEIEMCLLVVKSTLLSFVGGNPPPVALESGRRAIPPHLRPTFLDLEKAIKASKGK